QEHQKKLAAVVDRIKKVQVDLKACEDQASREQESRRGGIVVDDAAARLVGSWKPSTYSHPYVGERYLSDDHDGKGEKSATFTPVLPQDGEYEVAIAYTASSNRSRNTPVTIRFTGGETTVALDQTE